ncbi:MAG: F0F1 ATP synthase subunit B family protein [Planctomycetota bacterium]|jgi:F0F1-type ATP synthase membrane subunit b/b'
MTAEEKTENTAPAKEMGIKILKVYGIVYVLMIILYIVHCVSGSEKVLTSELKPGRRVWSELSFEYKNERIEIAGGNAFTPLLLSTFLESSAAAELEDNKLEVYKTGFPYNLSWAKIYGILNFTGLALLLYTALGDLLPKVLSDYSAKLEKDLSEARKSKELSVQLKARHEEMLKEVAAEKERLIRLAQEEAVHEHKRILAKTEDDVIKLKESLKRHLESEIGESIERLKAEISIEAIAKARQSLTESADKKVHEKMVADFIFEMKGADIK